METQGFTSHLVWGCNSSNNHDFGPHSREPLARPLSYFGESSGGFMPLGGPFPFPQNSEPPGVPQMAGQVNADPWMMRPQICPPQNLQPLGERHDISQQRHAREPHVLKAPSEALDNPYVPQPSKIKSEDHQNSAVSLQRSPATCAPAFVDDHPEGLDRDWSQHFCPDGFKYYYNCLTFESRWEKPDEFHKFEQELNKWREQQNTSAHFHPIIAPSSAQQVA